MGHQPGKVDRQGRVDIAIVQRNGPPMENTHAPMTISGVEHKHELSGLLLNGICSPKYAVANFDHARGQPFSEVFPMHAVLDCHFQSEAKICIAEAGRIKR